MTRHPELDLLRTLAVLMMIVFHLAYDLHAFYGWDIDPFAGGWLVIQRMTASLFLLLVGAGFAISWERINRRFADGEAPVVSQVEPRIAAGGLYRKYAKRGLALIGMGMIVSLVTWVIDPGTYVRFGVLHLIGTGILLLPFFARMKEWNVVLGMLVITMGIVVGDAAVPTSLLVPLGFPPAGFSSVDYFPLMPWFGMMLMGYGAGYWIYVRHKRPFSFTVDKKLAWMTWPGRKALIIYLVHQPILLALLWGTLGHMKM